MEATTHSAELFQLPGDGNYEIRCSCGEISGLILTKKLATVNRILREHEETGLPLPGKGIHSLDIPIRALEQRPAQ